MKSLNQNKSLRNMLNVFACMEPVATMNLNVMEDVKVDGLVTTVTFHLRER